MEIKQKLSFLSVIFATILLVSCGGADTMDENAAGAGAGSGSGSTGAASAETVAETAGVEAAAAAEMLTVFYFDFDEATLTSESKAGLDVAAGVLKASGKAVSVQGHADERGTPEYNLALGERRAKAVASYLSSMGVDKSKLETVSYGEEKPVMTGSDESSWAKNRRVELK